MTKRGIRFWQVVFITVIAMLAIFPSEVRWVQLLITFVFAGLAIIFAFLPLLDKK